MPRLIQCNYWSLTSAERGYAVIEIKGLAIQYAIEDCCLYLFGKKFSFYRSPTIRRNLNLSEVMNPRLLSYRLKLVQYTKMDVIWTKGKSHLIADVLSRAPIFDLQEDSGDNMALCYGVQPKDPLLHAVYNAAIADPVYQSVVTVIKQGKLVSILQKGHPGKSYKSVWDQI
jgi:hypothetical protein